MRRQHYAPGVAGNVPARPAWGGRATAHELADGVAYVLVIAAKPVNPADNQHVAGPQFVEQPL
jgi:hypothetical protein